MDRDLIKALRIVLDLADTARCSELGHKSGQFHGSLEPCPVEKELQDSASKIRAWMLKN